MHGEHSNSHEIKDSCSSCICVNTLAEHAGELKVRTTIVEHYRREAPCVNSFHLALDFHETFMPELPDGNGNEQDICRDSRNPSNDKDCI